MNIWAIDALEDWAAGVFESCGLEVGPALHSAKELVRADMRGIHSHGLSRVASYVHNLRMGISNPRPDFRFEERAGTIIFDADCGLGQVAGAAAVAHALDAARNRAFVPVILRNVGHLGALGL